MNGNQYKLEFTGQHQPEMKKVDWSKFFEEKNQENAYEEKMIQETLNRSIWEKQLREQDEKSLKEVREQIQKSEAQEIEPIDEDDLVNDNTAEYLRYQKIKLEQDEQKRKSQTKNDNDKNYRRGWNRYMAR